MIDQPRRGSRRVRRQRRWIEARDSSEQIGEGWPCPYGVPEEACDRTYELVFSHGVLIHCPLDVIRALLASAWQRVAPGGELRLQVLADPTDPEGVVSIEAAEQDHATAVAIDRVEEELEDPLIDGRYYMGHAFRYADVQPLLEEVTDGSIQVVRPTLTHVYGIVTRAAD